MTPRDPLDPTFEELKNAMSAGYVLVVHCKTHGQRATIALGRVLVAQVHRPCCRSHAHAIASCGLGGAA